MPMDRFETLESQYPELTIHFDKDMPASNGGFIYNYDIFLNGNEDLKTKRLETLAEEIGHYETTAGNITHQSNNVERHDEHTARVWGCTHLISLDELVYCYESGILTAPDIADYFEVSIGYLWEAIGCYREKRGEHFTYYDYHFDLSHGLNIFK